MYSFIANLNAPRKTPNPQGARKDAVEGRGLCLTEAGWVNQAGDVDGRLVAWEESSRKWRTAVFLFGWGGVCGCVCAETGLSS